MWSSSDVTFLPECLMFGALKCFSAHHQSLAAVAHKSPRRSTVSEQF